MKVTPCFKSSLLGLLNAGMWSLEGLQAISS